MCELKVVRCGGGTVLLYEESAYAGWVGFRNCGHHIQLQLMYFQRFLYKPVEEIEDLHISNSMWGRRFVRPRSSFS